MKHNVFVRARFPRSRHDEQLQAELITNDPLGFLEEDDWWEVYFGDAEWAALEEQLLRRWQEQGMDVAPDVQRFDQENWNKQWENSIQPIQVSERIVITPSWHEAEAAQGTLVLTIDPKMSFGTGYHATTRLMLRLLDGNVAAGESVLDMGTGTGVLAIAAVRLGAARAEGVDTDEWSYDNALENAQKNSVEDRVFFSLGSIDQARGPYDVILSNITKIDNLQMLPRFKHMLEPGGRLILSGFYESDLRELRLALEQLRLPVEEVSVEDEWAAILAVQED
jgi:ribosomal protein L11 methyltransferase